MREYLDNILSASTAKEEQIQQMANDARRKDNQLASILSRMDAKDKKMTDLIAQVTSMSTQCKRNNDDDKKSHRTRNNKRKAKESGAGRTGSGDGGEWLELKGPAGYWTPHGKCNFPLAKGAPFLASEVKWDSSWPADKKAYYNARKEVQEGAAAKGKREP